ncbi:uncharacterized protein Z518_05017 [Rhinocladiella mackenziei CBS 650.93]|uniref:F-box domain-containing protein n=1 Tax=Rhinocladiella mackenziei CBS 650.93 TaxID=1442369 RepID=A0A0D2JD33_9EURO|nr:uncharacterized protein Z518_05017 [Rhinocladiella mackenziei CBS 650.93]KIX07040.1 hypothetical protein Z518_05017 [Rhinocladiella mackenziei CBS 650.93]
MFRLFMKLPPGIVHGQVADRSPSVTPQAKILQLPTEILDAIFDNLDVLDRCCFALCCKSLLRLALSNEHLEYLLITPPKIESLQHFFQDQLGRGWIPNDLRYCPDCGKFTSTAEFRWRIISEKYSRELSGRVSHIWRARREDGWLRYWIERWCRSGFVSDNMATVSLIREDPTTLVCPKCAMQNPDCNKWRQLKSQPAREQTLQVPRR